MGLHRNNKRAKISEEFFHPMENVYPHKTEGVSPNAVDNVAD